MLGIIYYGLKKWFAKNCFVIILIVEFGWNFTLMGPCTKLFNERRTKKKKWRINWKRKKKEKKKKKNEKGMQFLEGNSCEPLLQRPLHVF